MEQALRAQAVFIESKPVPKHDAATPDAEFASIVERQSRFVFRVAYAVLRNVHDAEDVVQETFFKLYRNNTWREVRDEKSFLARVAWRIAVDRRPTRQDQAPDDAMVSPETGPEAAVIEADRNAVVHRLIDALPEDLRQPLVLSAIEELDSPRISEIMGIPEGTVRTRIMRARNILKQKLAMWQEGRHGN